MDSITHIVIGAAQGELIAGKKLGKKAMLWGALANSLPDIDVVFGGFNHGAEDMLMHRGITHSILFAVVMPMLLGFLMHKRYKELSLSKWIFLIMLGLFTHILLDSLNTYGIGWFEPFSHYRISFNTIFVADPLFTLPLLVSFIALLILKKDSQTRMTWNSWGILLSSAYMLFTFYNKYQVNNVVKENLATQQISYTDYFSTPTPLNNLLWYVVVKQAGQYQLGYYSVFDKETRIPFYTVRQNDSLLNKYENRTELHALKYFSQGYFSVTKDSSGNLEFHDLRFGQIGGWTNPTADFMFTYQLKKNADNTMAIQQGRFKSAWEGNAFSGLLKRIKGRE